MSSAGVAELRRAAERPSNEVWRRKLTQYRGLPIEVERIDARAQIAAQAVGAIEDVCVGDVLTGAERAEAPRRRSVRPGGPRRIALQWIGTTTMALPTRTTGATARCGASRCTAGGPVTLRTHAARVCGGGDEDHHKHDCRRDEGTHAVPLTRAYGASHRYSSPSAGTRDGESADATADRTRWTCRARAGKDVA